jgi:ribosomal protein S3
VLGYRIIVTGRRGSRSSKQVVSFGRLDSRVGASWLDFGSSHLVTKKGAMGVRVWILYSSAIAPHLE